MRGPPRPERDGPQGARPASRQLALSARIILSFCILLGLTIAAVLVAERDVLRAVADAHDATAKVGALRAGGSLDEELAALERVELALDRAVPQVRGVAGARIAARLTRSARAAQIVALRRDFALPALRVLAAEVVREGRYLERRDQLAVVSMLAQPARLDARAEAMLGRLWYDLARPRSALPPSTLDELLARQARAYTTSLGDGSEPSLAIDPTVAIRARAALASVPALDRVESFVFDPVREGVVDPRAPRTGSNLRFPEQGLAELLSDRKEMLSVLQSRRASTGGAASTVGGAYTVVGRWEVLCRMMHVGAAAAGDAWVVPPSDGERGLLLEANLRRLHDAYTARAVEQWTAFLEDLVVTAPSTAADAAMFYRAMTRAEWPYVRLLRTMHWDTSSQPLPAWDATGGERCGFEGRPLLPRLTTLTDRVAPLTIFADLQRLEPAGGGVLERWGNRLAELADLLEGDALRRADGRAQFRRARDDAHQATARDLAGLDESTRRLWALLLLDPLRFDPEP